MGEAGTFFMMLQQEKNRRELAEILACNEETARFGLALSREEARELAMRRDESLRKWERVEFGRGILEKLIFMFCDSPYLDQDTYAEVLEQLQDMFYEFKNETLDRMTDDELLEFMREQFDEVCFGDVEYLEGTCLDRLAQEVRRGFEGYKATGGGACMSPSARRAGGIRNCIWRFSGTFAGGKGGAGWNIVLKKYCR